MKTALVAGLLAVMCAGIYSAPEEARLMSMLRKTYRRFGTTIRPVSSVNQQWNVSFSVTLLNILDVDFSTQTVEVLMWRMMTWDDMYLRWDRDEFKLTSVRMKASEIPIPDITLYNSVSKYETLGQQDLVVVANQGHTFFVPQVKQRFTCPMDAGATNITCSLKFGSWTYSGFELNLTQTSDHMDLSSYQVNPQWDLVGNSVKRNEVYYPCCPEPYIDLTYTLNLRRK